jgi:hypothetical protein
LKFFVGKGRKKGIETEKKIEKVGGKPTLSTMLYYEKKKE